MKTNFPKIKDGLIKVWVIGNINVRDAQWVGGDLGQIIITYSTFQGHKDALNHSREGDFTAVIRIHSLAEIQLLLRTAETYPVFNRAAPLAAVASALYCLNISSRAEMWILVVTCGWAAFLSPLQLLLNGCWIVFMVFNRPIFLNVLRWGALSSRKEPSIHRKTGLTARRPFNFAKLATNVQSCYAKLILFLQNGLRGKR